MKNITITAEIDADISTPTSTTVCVRIVGTDTRRYIEFTSRDHANQRVKHAIRASAYAAAVSGCRSLAHTVLCLAQADLNHSPKNTASAPRIDLMFVAACAEEAAS